MSAAYKVIERELVFMHRRAVVEMSITAADFFMELAKATGLSLDAVLEYAAFMFAEQAHVADALIAWAEAVSTATASIHGGR